MGIDADHNAETYEVYVVRYATNPNRKRGNNLILDPRPEEPQPMDFYTWAIIGSGRAYLVDTGMHADMAEKHGHSMLVSPTQILPKLDIDPSMVEFVLLTHMHYDHVGNLRDFPRATFFLPQKEMDFVVSSHMEKYWFNRPYAVHEINGAVELLYNGRLKLFDGADYQIAPGLSMHWVGGHTAGQQVVRVRTKRGWVVLASDALHYYEEYERCIPFAVAYDFAQMLSAHDRIRELADSDNHIIPGHDPRVMDLYSAPRQELDGIVVQVDSPPKASAVSETSGGGDGDCY